MSKNNLRLWDILFVFLIGILYYCTIVLYKDVRYSCKYAITEEQFNKLVDERVQDNLKNLNYIVIEANYDINRKKK